MKILVTGGAGFIGSHTCAELLNSGFEVTVVDNLSNSSEKSINCVWNITGKDISFHVADVRDKATLGSIFNFEHLYAVIHFAGLKVVCEPVENHMNNYSNDIDSTLVLTDVMRELSALRLFSHLPLQYMEIRCLFQLQRTVQRETVRNPYGWTKWMIEQMLIDMAKADPTWNITL